MMLPVANKSLELAILEASQGESAEVLLYVAEGRESISHLYQGKCLLDINQLSPSY
jgi:hypothetical protein